MKSEAAPCLSGGYPKNCQNKLKIIDFISAVNLTIVNESNSKTLDSGSSAPGLSFFFFLGLFSRLSFATKSYAFEILSELGSFFLTLCVLAQFLEVWFQRLPTALKSPELCVRHSCFRLFQNFKLILAERQSYFENNYQEMMTAYFVHEEFFSSNFYDRAFIFSTYNPIAQ